MAKDDVEYRYLEPDVAECRILKDETGKRFIEGHASVFSQPSKLLFEDERYFNEIISPNAFDNVLSDERLDVPMTFNHTRGMLLGRTKSNTLQLSKDEKGLKFRVEVPNTTTGNDVYELVSRGDLYENSFAFVTDNATWTRSEDGGHIRTVNNVKKLVDVSVVTNGAYANTDVAARSLDGIEDTKDASVMDSKEDDTVEQNSIKEELEHMRMYVQLLKIKLLK